MTAAAATVTLMNGRQVTVKGDAESVRAMFKTRTLTADDGMRQVVTTEGETVTVATQFVGMIEAAETLTRNPVGFVWAS